MKSKNIKNIISLWFSEAVKPLWFKSTKGFDATLEHDYSSLLTSESERLSQKNAPDEPLVDSAQHALALVILFDQFPLNMYRGEPRSFATEQLAVTISRDAIKQGFDSELTDEQKSFLYMPFMHSENIADQDLAISLFEHANLEGNIRFAQHHRDIVYRFGRFPHRNEILGRKSTPDELSYLNSEEAFHG